MISALRRAHHLRRLQGARSFCISDGRRSRGKTIGIVGLGTAGTAAAIFLAKQGHNIKVFEKTNLVDTEGFIGAGIGMQPIGLTVLRRLGVLGPILSHGHRIDRLYGCNPAGKTVLDVSYADYHSKLYGLGLHRAVLFHELVSKAQSYPNIEVSYGSTITTAHVEHTETELISRVIHSDQSTAGSFLVDEKGTLEGPFDMLIFADGRRSVRAKMPIDKYVWESWYKFGCFWALLPDKEKAFVGDPTLSQVYDGCDVMLGLLPTGHTPTMDPSEAQLVSLFWSVEVAAVERIKAQGLDSWKAQVIGLQPRCEKLLESVRAWDDLIVAEYSDTIMPHFDFGNAVFIGDSAHATSPQLGQGANLALVDAWKLSEAMKMSGMNGASSSVQEALAAYNRDRRWRLWFYQMNSKLLTPVFQSNSRLIGAARDTLMGPLCQFEPTKLQMLTTLIGAQNNLVPYSTIPKEEFMGFVEGVPEDLELDNS